ncbi:hypothetical protein HPP92_011986 [Vanilla planifolia]|uniref:Equilibrative nucleoside transporter n=1 Tax=Vanilla planifolia TaxID=51239 RepID=A0A835RCQ6_VANPL|nr:hypothetical protein HPP92_011986 [Vanilla planifolia]
MRPCLERHNSDLIQTGSARLDHFSAYWLGEARSGAGLALDRLQQFFPFVLWFLGIVGEQESMTFNSDDLAAVTKKARYFANFVCWLLGNGSLFAWSSMLTAVDYYSALFPKYHPARIFSGVYISFCFVTSAILTYNVAKLNTRKRIIFGYTLFFINAVLIVVIDLATSRRGGIVVFLALCIITAACGVADAFVQGGMVGDLSFMDSNLMQFYRLKAAAEGSKTVYADLAAAKSQVMSKLEAKESTTNNEDPQQLSRLTTGQLLIKNLDYCLDLYLIYTITFSIVPGFLSEDTGNHSLGSWYALVLLSMYNVTDLIGRCSPLINCVKIESRKVLMLACISRFLFIPAFYLAAKHGEQGWMIMLISLVGLTNGHLTVCILTAAPKGYRGPEANALGNLLIVFLQGGLLSGVSLDWLWLLA